MGPKGCSTPSPFTEKYLVVCCKYGEVDYELKLVFVPLRQEGKFVSPLRQHFFFSLACR